MDKENNIIRESKPISEAQKENLFIKEKLDLALNKLREIINGLPDGDPERKRAQHTLLSIENASKDLNKNLLKVNMQFL